VKIATKNVLASFLTLSAKVPGFAAKEDNRHERRRSVSATRPHGQRVAMSHAQRRHAGEVRAYAPDSTLAEETIDFGIGSQRSVFAAR
jgi:hypothetical protein